MGLYYTPNPPHIGGAQPLEGKKLTPSSGPAPQNPPFNGGSRIHPAILGCWAAVAVAAAILPTLPRNITPPTTVVAASRPVPNTALQNILIAWTPPAPMSIVARNLTPPSAPTGIVTLDAAGSLQQLTSSQASPISYTGITVAGNALVACLNFCGNSPPSALPGGTGTLTLTWDQGGTNQAMTQIGTVIDSVNSSTLYYYALLNPTPGNKTLQVSWSNGLSSQYNLAGISFNNVDQSSLANAFPHFTTNSGSSTAPGVNVTSAVNHMALAMTTGGPTGALSTPNQTALFTTSNTTDDCGVQYANGASTVSFTWVLSSSTAWSSMGIDIAPGAAAVAFVPRGSQVPIEVLASWASLQPIPIVGPKLPPLSAPVAAFPFRGSSVPAEVMAAWTPAPFFQVVQELLDPPLTGTNDPPFMGGAAVPQAILNAWIPPNPAPIVIDNLVPPITGTNDPPFAGGAKVQQAVLSAWIAAAPAPIVASSLPPQPVVVATFTPSGARVPLEVLDAWIAPAPDAIVARNLTPPSGPAAFLPSGSFVPREVLINWLPPAPAAIIGPNLPPQPVVIFTPVGARVSLEVLDAWLPPAPMPIVAVNLIPPQSGPTNPPFIGGAAVPPAVQIAWLPAALASIVARNLTPPSGPVAAFLPAVRLPTEILSAWQMPAPAPMMAQNLTPPSGPVVSTPLFANLQVSPAFLASWASVPWTIILFSPAPIQTTIDQPIGASVRQEILDAWLPAAWIPMAARNLTPPSGPATPQNPPFAGGARVTGEVLINWLPIAPAPQIAAVLPPQPQQQTFVPYPGLPLAIQIAWSPAPYAPMVAINLTPPSGPVASDPPFMGGASVRREIQLAWQAVLPGNPPLKAINATPPSGPPPIVSAEIHAKPFFVSFGLRPL